MNGPHQDARDRLDSWKAIALYLDRDERTVQRWERELGLPIRRVPGGRGRSVFAYPSEIDAWLQTRQQQGLDAPPAPVSTPIRRVLLGRTSRVAAVAAVLLAAMLVWRLRPAKASATELRLESSAEGVVAFDAAGSRRWQYRFPLAYTMTVSPGSYERVRPAPGEPPAIFLATECRVRRIDGVQESGELTQLGLDGRLEQSFSFTDNVTFGGTTFGPPWVVTAFAIDESGGARRIAIAAHHAVWSASLVTVLDGRFQRHGTFVHAGWIEQLQWMAPNRLVIAGFSNGHDGGMVALLDPTAPHGVDGRGPEAAGSSYYCERCPAGAPLRMAVMPRTELNRVTASPFNRARLRLAPGRILVRTIEIPRAGEAAADALYEFTPSLDLVRASYGDHYLEVRRSLALEGKLPRAPAPTRPPQIDMWDPHRGWTTVNVR